MKAHLWKKYAPEGNDWAPPTDNLPGGMEATTTNAVLDKLLDRAANLYYQRRPVPAETVVPLP